MKRTQPNIVDIVEGGHFPIRARGGGRESLTALQNNRDVVRGCGATSGRSLSVRCRVSARAAAAVTALTFFERHMAAIPAQTGSLLLSKYRRKGRRV